MTTPAGWYHDPASQRMRWWDGARWTETFAPPAARPNGFAGASLGLAVAALIGGFFVWPGIILGVAGIICGIAGLTRKNGRGLAIAGLVISSVIVVFLACAAIIVAVGPLGGS